MFAFNKKDFNFAGFDLVFHIINILFLVKYLHTKKYDKCAMYKEE